METGFLSGQAGAEEISKPLRHAAQYGGSELYFSPIGEGIHAQQLDRRYARELSLWSESAPDPDSYQAAERHGGFSAAVCVFLGAPGAGREARPGAVSVAAEHEVRRHFAA